MGKVIYIFFKFNSPKQSSFSSFFKVRDPYKALVSILDKNDKKVFCFRLCCVNAARMLSFFFFFLQHNGLINVSEKISPVDSVWPQQCIVDTCWSRIWKRFGLGGDSQWVKVFFLSFWGSSLKCDKLFVKIFATPN